MLNTTKPARRAALRAMLAVSAIAAVPAAASAALSNPDDVVLDLWSQRHALRQPGIDALIAQDDAEARMPEWARPGLDILNPDGKLTRIMHVGLAGVA